MSSPQNDNLIDQYVQIMQMMTSAQVAHRLGSLVQPDVSFHDPRFSAQGPDELAAAMASLFDRTEGITIRITDRAWGQDGHTVYLRWDRLLKFSGGSTHGYSGISEVMIGTSGKIASILDHWDGADHVLPKRPRLLGRFFQR
ncbi:MAG TPA: nuclear transport factor 2 family protein [Alphaproteobacteria bacterium]